MKSGSALMTLMIMFVLSVPVSAFAWQDDPVVIRGPAGSEQTDMRQGEETYGPVTRRDTLWRIAHQVRPHSSVSIPQVMSAIVQANPHAFLDNNPNALETGFLLRIPSLQEIQIVNPQAAQRHIELGEQLQRSDERLQSTQAATEETDARRVALLSRTSDEARSALQEVRDEYAEEFAELRERLSLSIENTEAVMADNQDLQQRIDSIAEALEDIQRTMVAENDFQEQVRELVDEQQSLRLEQREAREVEQSQGLANRIMSNPLALILLAFVPALILIVIATLVLRRREGQGELNPAPPVSNAANSGENVTAAGMVDASEVDSDDFELDEAMAEFDDLDDDDDEGDDLSALEDEMLVPDEEQDGSIQLDDEMDDLDLSEFDALETELGADGSSADDLSDDDLADENLSDNDAAADEKKSQAEDNDQALSQEDLDDLFAGEFDPDEDAVSSVAADEEDLALAPKNQTIDAEDDAEQLEGEDEPSPAELFAGDDDEPLDLETDDEGTEATDDEFDMLGDDDDADFDKMMAQFADDDADEDLDDDDIESLLAKSDALISASEAEQGDLSDEPDTAAAMDDDDKLTEDTAEATELNAEEPLDFDSADDEDRLPAESEKPDNTADAAVKETDSSFIDIDDILDEADDEPEEADEPQSSESRRADEEDNLAAQLDLARAYLEMDETDEARETIEGVIEQASGELLKEAKELLARLDG